MHKIILIQPQTTTRLFLHEYIHKKSANKEHFGIQENNYFWALNEALTEKITCEILNLPLEEQLRHPYFSMFTAVEKLCIVIPWKNIYSSYFNNDTSIYYDYFQNDILTFLNYTKHLYIYNPYTNSKNDDIILNYELYKTYTSELIDKHQSL